MVSFQMPEFSWDCRNVEKVSLSQGKKLWVPSWWYIKTQPPCGKQPGSPRQPAHYQPGSRPPVVASTSPRILAGLCDLSALPRIHDGVTTGMFCSCRPSFACQPHPPRLGSWGAHSRSRPPEFPGDVVPWILQPFHHLHLSPSPKAERCNSDES